MGRGAIFWGLVTRSLVIEIAITYLFAFVSCALRFRHSLFSRNAYWAPTLCFNNILKKSGETQSLLSSKMSLMVWRQSLESLVNSTCISSINGINLAMEHNCDWLGASSLKFLNLQGLTLSIPKVKEATGYFDVRIVRRNHLLLCCLWRRAIQGNLCLCRTNHLT